MPQPRKPTALKELQGTTRRDRANPREARPKRHLPDPPASLDAEAKREWRRAGKILLELGLVTEADRATFTLYCQAWSRLVEASRAVATLQKAEGVNPAHLATWFGIERKARAEVGKWAGHFGMSPSTRAGVTAAEVERPVSKLAAFRSKRRGGGGPE